MRVSRDGGRTYDREHRLTSRPPPRPAAVCLYDASGAAQALAVDLDVSRGGRAQVLADAAQLAQLLDRAGARYLIDESPTGGRHVWVPLDRPRSADELRHVVRALTVLLPSLDPTPALNPTKGCLRPPGAAHPRGGHQRLVTPWAQAVDAVRTRTSTAAWSALVDLLSPQLAAVPAAPTAGPVAPDATARPGGPRPLPASYDAIARTGGRDPDRYRSPSEARMAVLASAAAHGWSQADVQAALAGGRWPGLAGFYARYRPAQRPRALARDWAKALSYAAALTAASARPPVANSHTGEHPSQPPPSPAYAAQQPRRLTEYVHVRVWRTAVDLAVGERWANRAGQSKRAVLAALAEAAHRRGSRYVDVGCRSLGLGATLDYSTVADVLRALREEDDPVLVLLENHRGERGDLYELRIPDSHREAAEATPWRPGRLTGLHPVFWELGVPAAHLYEALDAGPADLNTLVDATHLSRATVYRAAGELAAHGLLVRVGGRWRRTRLRLDVLARRLGIPSRVTALLQRIRQQRQEWRALLRLTHGLSAPDPMLVLAELADLPPPPEPPPDPDPSPLELLHLILGAVPTESS